MVCSLVVKLANWKEAMTVALMAMTMAEKLVSKKGGMTAA